MENREKVFYVLTRIFNNNFGGIKQKEHATIYGYVMAKLWCFTENNDGTITCPTYWNHRNKFQWIADREIDEVVKTYNERKTK